ncbi:hypothetical protein TRVL_01842 [Trypanosoma vivax]|nr:hypothetical protein TRVL_01842 [Trypanosoma vivax]
MSAAAVALSLAILLRCTWNAEAASATQSALKVSEAKKICDVFGALKLVARHAAQVRESACGQALVEILSESGDNEAKTVIAQAAAKAADRKRLGVEAAGTAELLTGLLVATRHAAAVAATADLKGTLAEQLARRMDSVLEVFEKYKNIEGDSVNYQYCLGTGTKSARTDKKIIKDDNTNLK